MTGSFQTCSHNSPCPDNKIVRTIELHNDEGGENENFSLLTETPGLTEFATSSNNLILTLAVVGVAGVRLFGF